MVYAFYPGQEGGNALAQILFGDVNPSGKLPVSMPKYDEQLPPRDNDFNDDAGCGYFWLDRTKQIPEFAFGFGLSYTSFTYSNLQVTPVMVSIGQEVTVTVDVTNSGSVAGQEVVQFYLSQNDTPIRVPLKKLVGFEKVSLDAGQTKSVNLKLTPESFYLFDENQQRYFIPPSSSVISVGGSSDNLPLSAEFYMLNAAPKPDLVISHVRTVPRYPQVGDSVIFLAQLVNQGSGASPVTVHDVSFQIDSVLYNKSLSFANAIPAGGSALVCAEEGMLSGNQWVPSAPGTYTILAWVNESGTITESNIQNNRLELELVVQ